MLKVRPLRFGPVFKKLEEEEKTKGGISIPDTEKRETG